jgi:hypothetical protein
MKAYARSMGTSRNGEIQSFIALMRRKTFGKYVPLFSAPKRETLKCFGGTMTIDEFRACGGNVEPPQVYWPFQKLYIPTIGGEAAPIQSASTGFKTGASSGKLQAIETSSTKTDTLRLKRPKPLARTESKLENALGIKRKEKATP